MVFTKMVTTILSLVKVLSLLLLTVIIILCTATRVEHNKNSVVSPEDSTVSGPTPSQTSGGDVFTANTMPPLYFSKILISYFPTQHEEETIIINDSILLDNVYEMFSSINGWITTQPMDFPRYIVYFQKDGHTVSKWYIDHIGLTCADNFGLGNIKIDGGEKVYTFIEEIFASNKRLNP